MLFLKSPLNVRDLAFSHCGRWLAVGTLSDGVRVWDVTNPTEKPVALEEGDFAAYLAFRRDGSLFYTNSSRCSRLFDPVTHKLHALGGTRSQYFVVSPDGERIVRTAEHVPLHVWTVRDTGTPVLKKVKCPGYSIAHAAFAPDSALFAVYENHLRRETESRFVVRETATNKIVGAVTIDPRDPNAFVLTPGGTHIVASSHSTTNLLCWSFAEPKRPPRTAPNPNRKYFDAIAAHPSGVVLTADTAGVVRVWSVPDLEPYRTYEWKTGKLFKLAVSHDGTRVAAGGEQAKIVVWDWD